MSSVRVGVPGTDRLQDQEIAPGTQDCSTGYALASWWPPGRAAERWYYFLLPSRRWDVRQDLPPSSGDLLSHIQHNTRASSLTRTAKDLSHRAESPLWRPQALVRRATSTGVDQARQPRSLPDSRQDSMHLCPHPLGVVQPLPRGGTAQRRGKSQEVHTPSAWVRRYFSARGGVPQWIPAGWAWSERRQTTWSWSGNCRSTRSRPARCGRWPTGWAKRAAVRPRDLARRALGRRRGHMPGVRLEDRRPSRA